MGNGLVYVTTSSSVLALEPGTGEEVWRADMPRRDEYYKTPPYVDGDALYAAIDDTLVCIDALTGAERWTFQADASVFPSVGVTRASVIFGAGHPPAEKRSKFIYAVEKQHGALEWKFEYSEPNTPAWTVSPLVDENESLVYFGARAGKENLLMAVEASSGQRVWTTLVPDLPDSSTMRGRVITLHEATYPRIRNPGSSGITMDAITIVSCLDGLQLFERKTGAWLWSHLPVGYTRKPALANEIIVFATEGVVYTNMMVLAVGKASRKELWRYKVPAPFTDYTLSAKYVYLTSGWLDLGSNNSLLAVLSLHTGREVWKGPVADMVGLYPPIVAPDAVYVSGLEKVQKYGRSTSQ